MDEKQRRIAALEKQVAALRVDLDRLARFHEERNESCYEVADIVFNLAELQNETSELVREALNKVFPKNSRFTDEIERAIKRVRKSKPKR